MGEGRCFLRTRTQHRLVPTLEDDFTNDATADIGEAEVASRMAVSEPLVVEA